MSFQWTFIAGYLYFEIAVVMLMILPLFSPRKWYRFYRSRLFEVFHERTAIYFYGWMGILCLFLVDSIREMRKYSHATEQGHVHLASEMKGNVKLFRAQRNFYITGFAIFLAFVIRRLVIMIITQYELEVKAGQIIRKAEDTVKLAKTTVMETTQLDSDKNKQFEQMKNKLAVAESLLDVHKERVKELEEEASMWRLKYEELKTVTDGSGDK